MKNSNYNFIAPFYKLLSRIVFGKSLEKGSSHFFARIKKEDSVLIIGGGNGEILKPLFFICPVASISYCELSNKMIGLANKKNPFPKEQITFLEQDAFDLEDFQYDWIVLPFFLDQFNEVKCVHLLKSIKENSKPSSKILFTDMNKKGISRGLLSFMYFFFKMTTGLKNKELPDFDKVFLESGWEMEEEELFGNGRVVSRVYKKDKDLNSLNFAVIP